MTTKTAKPKQAKAVKTASASAKTKTAGVKGDVYKDPYSGKEYESKQAFVAMKIKGDKKTNFAILYAHLQEVVKKKQKEANVDVEKVGMKTMDARLPRYILGFINGGDQYKVSLEPKAWNKFKLTSK